MTDYRPIVDCLVEAIGVEVPDGMRVGLKFTTPDLRTHGGFRWPAEGEWTPDDPAGWNPRTCTEGGYHAALTIAAAQSGGGRYTHACLVAWHPDDEGETDESQKVKVRRLLNLRWIDIAATAQGGHLYRAYLTGANLYGAYLSRAYLTEADLSGADLSRAYLSGADLSGADLSGADLAGAYLYGADLSRVDLSEANLSGAHLYEANLSGAHLSEANLNRADLTEANLTEAHLYGANLYGAYLSEANLTEVRYDDRTRWPDGFEVPA